MTNPQKNTFALKTLTTNYIREGMKLGFKAGLIVSTLYSILGIFIVELLGHGTGLLEIREWWLAILALIWTPIIIITLFLSTLAPAAIIGFFTGMYIGKLVEIAKERVSKHIFVSICVLSCLVVVILFHLIFHIPVILSFQYPAASDFGVYETYPFSIGIPTIIYVLTGGLVSFRLYSISTIKMDKQP